MNELCELAIGYANSGLYVLPIFEVGNNLQCACNNDKCRAPGKHPRVNNWPQNASCDEATIREWWRQWPTANIGITTGIKSGIAVYDLDPKNGGWSSHEEIKKLIPGIENTFTVETGSGGRHLYFRIPDGVSIPSRGGLLAGIDIKGDGGYVCAPPSRHVSGKRYRILSDINSTTFADFPAKLLEIKKKTPPRQKNQFVIPEGERNTTLFGEGCSMRARGSDVEEIVDRLLELNQMCSPPEDVGYVRELAERIANTYPQGSEEAKLPRYEVVDGAICYLEKNKDEDRPKVKQLVNANIWISEQRTLDDGLEKRIVYKIGGMTSDGRPLHELKVLADRYDSLNWMADWGARVIIAPGFTTRDHLKTAIKTLSVNWKELFCYSFTGWCEREGEIIYLHALGGIRATGNDSSILVDFNEGNLNNFKLSPADDPEVIRNAIRASLEMLQGAKPIISWPLLASIYVTPLGRWLTLDFTPFVVGPSGVFKTSYSALAQSHFGDFNDRNLPESWTSTANTLERKSFLAKDAILIVDDYVPGVTNERDVERLLRAQGNKSGRGRMRSDASLRPPNFPRGLILSTGEDVPRGQSLRPRLLVIEIHSGDVNIEVLTQLQKIAKAGLLAQSMGCYIQWLAQNHKKISPMFADRFEFWREDATADKIHKRTPGVIASLMIGVETFLDFAVEKAALSREMANDLRQDAWKTLCDVADLQVVYQSSEDPVVRFLELLYAAFLMGRGHVLDAKTGEAPPNPKHWGWRTNHNGDWVPQGERVGWLHGEEIWLHPDAAFITVQKLAFSQNKPIPISKETLWKRLAQRGFIETSPGEQKNLIKRTVHGGIRLRVVVIKDKSLIGVEEDRAFAPVAPAKSGEDARGGFQLERYAQYLKENKSENTNGGAH